MKSADEKDYEKKAKATLLFMSVALIGAGVFMKYGIAETLIALGSSYLLAIIAAIRR